MEKKIEVRGAKVHNLKGIDVDIPLGKIVGIAGVSGSGKSSLALGVLYREGSRRYLESLSTYTRRRMTGETRAEVDEIRHVPAALALHQRPPVPGIRSTFGTMSELLSSLRLMFSRLASHKCPNGHMVPPSLDVALGKALRCPECGENFHAPSAEELSFNSEGACPECQGTGIVGEVDESTLVPDEGLSIEEGAVAPWKSLMWSLMTDVCRAMGVRTDVPYKDLTEEEKRIVIDGPMEKKHILYRPKGGTEQLAELDFTYYSAKKTVLNALSKVKDESGMKRVERFLKEGACPSCHGTRLSGRARDPILHGLHLDEACALPLEDLLDWAQEVPGSLPSEMRPMAETILESLLVPARRLIALGLGYLSLDRAGSTLSTGERQRVILARAVRNRTTGVLYVLDEPSIGLHPSNQKGLLKVMEDLKEDGNTVLLVDHDPRILLAADHLVEMGPGSGADGGEIIAQGPLEEAIECPGSQIAPYLKGTMGTVRKRAGREDMFRNGAISMRTGAIHTVRPLSMRIPKGRLVAVTGVSGSGKTTMVLESLVAGMERSLKGEPLPSHVIEIRHEGIRRVRLVDATPIGANVRSTVATYANIHDELRVKFAKSQSSKEDGLHAGDFSYNTGSLRCPECDGTGTISLDVQFLPDVEIPCPRCHGGRYSERTLRYRIPSDGETDISLPELMGETVSRARLLFKGYPSIARKLSVLEELGLGYLTLGESTPALSGGEAQRLKLAEELGKEQEDTLFVFDEPTIGLHPKDVETLLHVLDGLVGKGATLLVIEHDVDFIRNADWVIDMGPGGGKEGGRIVAEGTPEDIKAFPESLTGRYL